jgi:glycosyltransferase involved in cell wall biosynthesis
MSIPKDPTISIIVPVYNAEPFLQRCISSILAQTYTDFELILVDDGSTDQSGRICDEYASNDKRIIVIHQSNGGQSKARNAGIALARGKYLSFIDADDYIAEAMIKTLYELTLNFNADISECGYISVFPDREVVCEFGKQIEYGEGNFLVEKFISADIFYGVVTKLFDASLFEGIKFPVGRIYEDTWMTLNFCLTRLKYVRTPLPLYYYDQRSTSTLRSIITQQKAREFIYILEGQLDLINSKVADHLLKKRLFSRIMEKSVFWYLDLALSDQRILRRIYSKLYLRRMNFKLIDCLKSKNIPLRSKLFFCLCKAGLAEVLSLMKIILS